jgi:hypothetical protein
MWTGAGLIVLGLLWGVLSKVPFLGRLPGDIFIQRKNITFYFPLATSLCLSFVISFILWLFSRHS